MKIILNGGDREVADQTTVADLLAELGTPEARGVAVALDGTVVPRAERATTTLVEGSRVEIVTAVQGG